MSMQERQSVLLLSKCQRSLCCCLLICIILPRIKSDGPHHASSACGTRSVSCLQNAASNYCACCCCRCCCCCTLLFDIDVVLVGVVGWCNALRPERQTTAAANTTAALDTEKWCVLQFSLASNLADQGQSQIIDHRSTDCSTSWPSSYSLRVEGSFSIS